MGLGLQIFPTFVEDALFPILIMFGDFQKRLGRSGLSHLNPGNCGGDTLAFTLIITIQNLLAKTQEHPEGSCVCTYFFSQWQCQPVLCLVILEPDTEEKITNADPVFI